MNKIKNCAKEVWSELGGGYLEDVYNKALAVEFRTKNLNFDREYNVDVVYKDHLVGVRRLDFYLPYPTKTIVELKAIQKLKPEHERQLQTYLDLLGLRKGLLINFGHDELDIREVLCSAQPVEE